MSFIRPTIVFLAVARGETQLLLANAPAVVWRLLSIASWAFFAILMGSIVGFAAVALPPMGLVGIIAVFILILLWVLPEGPTPSQALIRRLMFVMVAVDLAVPAYYAYQVPGLPWISLRRVFTLAVIVLFAIAYSVSSESRSVIARVIRCNRAIFICAGGYLFMVYISVLTSIRPMESLYSASSVVLEWYVPLITAIYVVRNEKHVANLLTLVLACGLIVSAVGIIDSIYIQNTYSAVLPESMMSNLLANNPNFEGIAGLIFRDGGFRAKSVFNVALSFAEFEAIVAPVAAVLILHARSYFERVFGIVVFAACAVGIYVSGSRGGYLSLLTAAATFAPLFILRNRASSPRGMIAPVASATSFAGFSLIYLAILFVGKVRAVVFAHSAGDESNQARSDQWTMGWPHVFSNPVTGHGYGLGGDIVGYAPYGYLTLDSFALSLLVETGVPGFLFYLGMFLIAVYTGATQYIRDRTFAGALAGGLAASLAGYTGYRMYLAQRENQTLVYVMVACVALLNYFYQTRREQSNHLSGRAYDAPGERGK